MERAPTIGHILRFKLYCHFLLSFPSHLTYNLYFGLFLHPCGSSSSHKSWDYTTERRWHIELIPRDDELLCRNAVSDGHGLFLVWDGSMEDAIQISEKNINGEKYN